VAAKQIPNTEVLSTDIAVIGGGGGGLAAAVAAAEKGARVIVLEKRRALGGNANFAEGFFAAESPAQQRMNIDARRDELFRIAMDYSHWTINARILRAFIDKSGDTVRWLEDKGLMFDWIPALYPNQVPLVWHCLKGRGAVVVRLLRKCCQELGVSLLCGTPARKLLTDANGRVTGVLAAAKDKTLQINAGNVVIATGGFGGNKELLKKYARFYTEDSSCGGLPHTGDGLLMAWEAGADSEGLGVLQMIGPGYQGARIPGAKDVGVIATEPTTIWVNRDGERFADETTAYNIFVSANSILQQPGRFCYSLFDDQTAQVAMKEGVIKGAGIMIVPPRTRFPDMDKQLQLQAEKGGEVKISDSWDEIARWMGVATGTLKATVEEYNGFCDRGHDEVFAKDRRYMVPLSKPPYYAMKCYPGFLGTIGGIKINHRMEVISVRGEPIPGLYAAGVDTGGWESDYYCAALSGTTFGFALNSGRIAAENAVKSISK
jgi:fumarate reductase flavoprotein subunit